MAFTIDRRNKIPMIQKINICDNLILFHLQREYRVFERGETRTHIRIIITYLTNGKDSWCVKYTTHTHVLNGLKVSSHVSRKKQKKINL